MLYIKEHYSGYSYRVWLMLCTWQVTSLLWTLNYNKLCICLFKYYLIFVYANYFMEFLFSLCEFALFSIIVVYMLPLVTAICLQVLIKSWNLESWTVIFQDFLKLILVIFCISWKLAIGSINDIYETLTRFLSMKLCKSDIIRW